VMPGVSTVALASSGRSSSVTDRPSAVLHTDR
jgi:hypothetical protein